MSRSILNRSPLYVQIKQHILGDIRQGVWKPGEKLPTELDLAERFGVSVGTVRRAMGGLEDEGIISRREGSGTFVRTYKGTGNRNPFHIISGMDGKPRGTRKELVSLSSVVPPGFVSDALLVPRGKPVLLMVRKLWDDGNGSHELITVDESYLLPERFPGLTAERFRKSFREDDTLYKFYDREFASSSSARSARSPSSASVPTSPNGSRCLPVSRCSAPTDSPSTSRRRPSSTASTAAESSGPWSRSTL